MLEVISQWSGLGKSPKLSITYWAGTGPGPAQSATDQMRAFWDDAKAAFVGTTGVIMSNEVRELDPSDGALVHVHTVAPGAPVSGTGAGQPAADATQYLLRWQTGVITNGRRLSGRTFVPGVPVANISSGNVSSAVRTAWDTRIAGFLVGDVRLGVWHRPTPAAPLGGSFHPAVSGNCWTEYAVQRRRRG